MSSSFCHFLLAWTGWCCFICLQRDQLIVYLLKLARKLPFWTLTLNFYRAKMFQISTQVLWTIKRSFLNFTAWSDQYLKQWKSINLGEYITRLPLYYKAEFQISRTELKKDGTPPFNPKSLVQVPSHSPSLFSRWLPLTRYKTFLNVTSEQRELAAWVLKWE